MKPFARTVVFLLGAVFLSSLTSCYSVTVSLKDEAIGKFKEIPEQPEFKQFLMVGALRDELVQVQDRDGDKTAALHSVEIRNGFLYDLMGVLTLGFYRPIEVRYYLTEPFQGTIDPED